MAGGFLPQNAMFVKFDDEDRRGKTSYEVGRDDHGRASRKDKQEGGRDDHGLASRERTSRKVASAKSALELNRGRAVDIVSIVLRTIPCKNTSKASCTSATDM
jgi:hypothetical protein